MDIEGVFETVIRKREQYTFLIILLNIGILIISLLFLIELIWASFNFSGLECIFLLSGLVLFEILLLKCEAKAEKLDQIRQVFKA